MTKNTLLILQILASFDTKATFFILGWVAQYFPDLVTEIEHQGHEIASHGYSHELIYNMSPNQFHRDVSLSLDHLSKVTNKKILGYRAPGFSLTHRTLWALDILMDLGFKYDSSIFPMRRNHGGFENFYDQPTLMETPKRNMILEIPITPISCLNQKIYLLGGGYLRLFPYYLISLSLKKLNRQAKKGLVYLHPREIDSSHLRLEMSKYRKFISYINLNTTKIKLEKLLQEFKFYPAINCARYML